MNAERRTRPRGDARRREILDVALRLFAERGFNSVSIADVASEVGMTQAGLLHHFGTKAGLLLAVLQERDARTAEDDRKAREAGMDYLHTFLNTLKTNEANPALVQLFALLSAESIAVTHPGHDWFVQRYERLLDRATAEIADIVDEAKLPPGVDARTLAQWVIGLADGLRIQWLLLPGSIDRHVAVERFLDLLRPYLRTP